MCYNTSTCVEVILIDDTPIILQFRVLYTYRDDTFNQPKFGLSEEA